MAFNGFAQAQQQWAEGVAYTNIYTKNKAKKEKEKTSRENIEKKKNPFDFE